MSDRLQSWLTKALISFMLFVVFQGTYSIGNYYQYDSDLHQFIGSVEQRVSLDSAKLRLAHAKYNTVTHEPSVRDYITQLNQKLSEIAAPVRLIGLQDIAIEPYPNIKVYESLLSTSDQNINLKIGMLSWPYLTTITPYALLLALIIVLLARELLVKSSGQKDLGALHEPMDYQVKLIINLHSKTLSGGSKDSKVKMPNKPFCFYIALLDYCIHQKVPYLNHSNDVPEELLSAANKYFYRLIELGHTKRKRPDFNTNLDKTLSEIRAALDAVFLQQEEDKELFYPPKAQGEGSRSKLHNYAIEHLNAKQIEFIGR
ncbi:MAG: hypothetical protein ACI8Z9_000229 [Paraglaciecola sp.]|jgi:hypothetical protein